MADIEQKPLLDLEHGAEEEWDRVDALPRDIPTITVQQLIRQDPDHVLHNIKAGVVKVVGWLPRRMADGRAGTARRGRRGGPAAGAAGIAAGAAGRAARGGAGPARVGRWAGAQVARTSGMPQRAPPRRTRSRPRSRSKPAASAHRVAPPHAPSSPQLGEFKVPDTVLLRALDDRPMITMGADSAHIDYEAAWRARLTKLTGQPAARSGKRPGAGWSRMVTAEAFVVRIRHAARPDEEGLIRPLLMRWQAGGCHYSVFGLPAVHAVLQFKWDTFCGRALMAELVFFLTWLVSFSVFMLLWQDEDMTLSLPQLWNTPTGKPPACAGP
ncbi:hypothetical protein MNEG_11108 [Monoraphidium neglectum]|uniref:Uncharacterized protein n=1 Tax=Monoraphidium neglectum TaxID=145388 RepID=A0A0D2KM84_9CHLO|nr:hypothetical protein MNEG_11108 [Monoraphidium neglectum]KIY96853.1 hypothetical protein MNEG_11108 [Monoraphidium neglectum]|eukprot:XP_013895873.1 hypothetical protein MNEG_11108 [Monoraphidium neglectum]